MTEQTRQRLKEMMKYCIIYPKGCEPTETEDELLDTMKLRLKEWPNDIIEEGDNETTDAN